MFAHGLAGLYPKVDFSTAQGSRELGARWAGHIQNAAQRLEFSEAEQAKLLPLDIERQIAQWDAIASALGYRPQPTLRTKAQRIVSSSGLIGGASTTLCYAFAL